MIRKVWKHIFYPIYFKRGLVNGRLLIPWSKTSALLGLTCVLGMVNAQLSTLARAAWIKTNQTKKQKAPIDCHITPKLRTTTQT